MGFINTYHWHCYRQLAQMLFCRVSLVGQKEGGGVDLNNLHKLIHEAIPLFVWVKQTFFHDIPRQT